MCIAGVFILEEFACSKGSVSLKTDMCFIFPFIAMLGVIICNASEPCISFGACMRFQSDMDLCFAARR